MKKSFAAAIVIVAFVIFSVQAALAGPSNTAQDVSELLDERQTDIWVEGERFGDMVLGARGAMQVIYVDDKLSKSIAADSRLQPWVYDMAQYYGTDATRKKRLFIAHIDVYKPWDFDYTQVFIGGYHLQKGDILSSSMTNPFGPMASKSDGYFAFAVPSAEVKAGKEIKIGYGDDSETWKVPK